MKIEDFSIFKDIPTVKTERLILRKLRKSDLDDVFEYSSDQEVPRYLLWDTHKTKSVTKAYINRALKWYKCGQFYDWAIEFNGKMIGICGFSKIDVLNDTAEVGYVLNRSFWGQGIASEAVRAVLNFGFRTLCLLRIEAQYIEENERSKRVLEKCGFVSEGVRRKALKVNGIMRNVCTASVLSEDFFKNQIK